jgi:hypothetical protein
MDSSELIIKTRDRKQLVIKLDVILKMEDFMIKNLIEDSGDTSDIDIDEDYNIIKNILDSLKYKTLIFDDDVNLKLMYCVCDKWCVPMWLTDAIELQINQSKKLMSVTSFIDSLTNSFYKCKNCGVGFNKYNNKAGSCKYHGVKRTISGSNNHACCNKEEPCLVGYHTIDITDLTLMIRSINELGVL